ncbi:MAG TPA: hypothetical protein VJ748_10845 [Vitreimonas sp.]|nr:hypothetical protein [Vitreimonas sp.]
MIAFDVPAHIWLTLTLLVVGGGFWAFDDFIAERYRSSREADYAAYGLNDPDREVLGRDAQQELHAKSARYVGYGFLALGAVCGVALLIRLIV